jgi:hypothetical protein
MIAVLHCPLSLGTPREFSLSGRRMFERKLGVARLLKFDHERDSPLRAAKRERLARVLERDRVHVLQVAIRATLDCAPSKLGFPYTGRGSRRWRVRHADRTSCSFLLSEPSPVQIRTRSSSRPTQTGTLCGEPSGMRVARWAKLGPSSNARISLERGIAMELSSRGDFDQTYRFDWF